MQISEMNKDNREAEDAVAENARLRKLLKLAEKHTDFTYGAARVTGATSTSWESTITLSKGSSSGIEKTTPSSPKPATWWAWWRAGLQLVYRHHPGGPGHLHGRPGLPDR